MPAPPLRVRDLARELGVHTNTIRLYEASGYLPPVPRDPNGYRRYGAAEFGRLRVIRTLAQAGYNQMAILTMLRQVDAGNTGDLRSALNVPPDEASIYAIADRWLAALAELEQRAQAIIRQVGLLIELAHRA